MSKSDITVTAPNALTVSVMQYACQHIGNFWNDFRLITPYWRYYYNYQEGGVLVWDKHRIDLSKDKIYLIPSYLLFEGHCERNNPLNFYIHFSLDPELVPAERGIMSIPYTDWHRERIGRIFDHKPGSERNIRNTLVCTELVSEALNRLEFDLSSRPNIDSRISAALKVIEKNKPHIVSVDALAAAQNMSNDGFSRLFRKYVGFSPQQYQAGVRINIVSLFLVNSALPLEEIAQKCGFSDRHSLSKAFIQRMKMGPVEYRRKYSMAVDH